MIRLRLAMCRDIPVLKAALLTVLRALPDPQHKAKNRTAPQYSARHWPALDAAA